MREVLLLSGKACNFALKRIAASHIVLNRNEHEQLNSITINLRQLLLERN